MDHMVVQNGNTLLSVKARSCVHSTLPITKYLLAVSRNCRPIPLSLSHDLTVAIDLIFSVFIHQIHAF